MLGTLLEASAKTPVYVSELMDLLAYEHVYKEKSLRIVIMGYPDVCGCPRLCLQSQSIQIYHNSEASISSATRHLRIVVQRGYRKSSLTKESLNQMTELTAECHHKSYRSLFSTVR